VAGVWQHDVVIDHRFDDFSEIIHKWQWISRVPLKNRKTEGRGEAKAEF